MVGPGAVPKRFELPRFAIFSLFGPPQPLYRVGGTLETAQDFDRAATWHREAALPARDLTDPVVFTAWATPSPVP